MPGLALDVALSDLEDFAPIPICLGTLLLLRSDANVLCTYSEPRK